MEIFINIFTMLQLTFELFNIIVINFESFKDERIYDGTTIYFYKLAQLLTSDILHIREKLENKKVDSLILDLRGNTGGYLTSVTSIAEMFVKKGDIIYQLDTKGKIDKIKSKKDPSIKLKVAVLVNKSTASASEILTAALKENINAEVIGVTTYGKGKVQKTRTLSTGAMIKYTTQNWLTTKGEEIDGKGIAPTVELELDPKYYTNRKEANDNQLQKAIEMMSK